MRAIVLLTAVLVGCVAPPINITQGERDDDTPVNERWVIVVYDRRESQAAPFKMGPPIKSEAPAAVRLTSCPRFELPQVGVMPVFPDIESTRGNDYEYIAEVLIDHVEALIQHTSGLKRRYTKAYDRYLQACDLSVD